MQRLSARIAPLGGIADLDLLPAQRPAEIVNTSSLGDTPLLVAASLAGFAVLALGLGLLASVRRHARDLAILRTLGFADRQLFSAIIWQAYTILVSGTLVGLPIGLIASARLWNAFTAQLDVIAANRVPTLALTLVGSSAIIMVGLIAIGPAHTARRLAPASILRSTDQ
jgi:ABC-type lipoprotein release transport system permease subunit